MLVMRRVEDARACSVAGWSGRLEDSANALLAENAQTRVAGAASCMHKDTPPSTYPKTTFSLNFVIGWYGKKVRLPHNTACETISTSHSLPAMEPVKEKPSPFLALHVAGRMWLA
jgi:hypothetical protein